MSPPRFSRERLSARILVRGVNWLGDAIMTTPALLRLREAHPKAEITLLTDAKLADLWQHHPAVDSVLTFTKGDAVWAVARRLRERQFDIGLVLPNSTRSALEVWLGHIPRRVGYGGRGRGWLLTESIPVRPGAIAMRKRSRREVLRLVNSTVSATPIPFPASAHHLHQYLHLVSPLGASAEPMAPQIVIQPDEVQAFLRRWEITQSAAQPLLGLNPGAEYGPAKRWPAESFITAAIEVQKLTGCRWVIFGSLADGALAEQISQGIIQAGPPPGVAGGEARSQTALNLAGQTTLRQLAAGLKACRVVLTNDTGPMHLAAAVGTPVIVPFGSTSPELTGPGLPGAGRHQLLKAAAPCSPCFLRECPIDFRCMKSIGVNAVVEAVWRVVESAK